MAAEGRWGVGEVGLGSRMEEMVDMGSGDSRQEVVWMVAKGNQGNVVEAECELGMMVLVVMMLMEEKAQPAD